MKQLLKIVALVAVMATLSVQSAVSAPKLKYVDATTLNIINKAQADGPVFERIDGSKYEMPKGSRYYMRYTTGMAVTFKTDSRNIRAKWSTLSPRVVGSNSTSILHSGIDIYIRDNEGAWRYAGSARPKHNKTDHEFALVSSMAEGVKECLLYLPAFNGLTSLEVGVDENATIETLPSPFKHKIVFVGSSLTHGASASRPGATYVARIGRMLNAEVPNIGLSGKCRLDDYFADIVCDTKADAFVFDAFSNSTKAQIDERLYNFVKRITKAHPTTPMIFLQTEKRDIGYFNLNARKRNDDQRAAAEEWMKKICKEYKTVYFVNPGLVVGDDGEGTVDGTHLNDLGVQRTLDVVVPQLKKILKKYGVK